MRMLPLLSAVCSTCGYDWVAEAGCEGMLFSERDYRLPWYCNRCTKGYTGPLAWVQQPIPELEPYRLVFAVGKLDTRT